MTQPFSPPDAPVPARAQLVQGQVVCSPGTRPSAQDVEQVAYGLAHIAIAPEAVTAMAQSEALLDTFIADGRCIYGVTTGYGPLANNHIDSAVSDTLQRNLVYHLATGVGRPFSWASARAIMVCRLQALCQGLSAVSPRVTGLLKAALDAGLAPVIPEKGTVGASGDLTPLSHLALALMGEGAWMDVNGPLSNEAAFLAMGQEPLSLGPKEGLALVNGTSAMTGVAALNGALAKRLLTLACVLSVMNAEIFSGHAAAWHPLVGAARGQPGQDKVHSVLAALMADSRRLQPYDPTPAKLKGEGAVRHDQVLPQDPYSIRCVPQLLGACLDMLTVHDETVLREISAVTDNPLVFAEEGALIHAGNFFGQHIAFASDALANAAIMIAVLLERQIARVTDVTQSQGLPAFLQGRETGLNSGFMGAQVTASALVAEMRTKANPASIQSIPTNANNQDVVTMGTIAARRARDILEDVARVSAIHALCMAQALDLRKTEKDCLPFSACATALHGAIRNQSAFLAEDRPLSAEIEAVATALQSPTFLDEGFEGFPLVKMALAQF